MISSKPTLSRPWLPHAVARRLPVGPGPARARLKQLRQGMLTASVLSTLMCGAIWQLGREPLPEVTLYHHFQTCEGGRGTHDPVAGVRTLRLAGEIVPLDMPRVYRLFAHELQARVSAPRQTRALTLTARAQLAVIDPILRRYGLPRDLRYVPIAESAGQMTALSPKGAAGPWQLMAAPAREMGLRLDEEVDERYHLERSTEAACRYLKMLYAHTGSWANALAAYNGGLGRFERVSKAQGHDDFYRLWFNPETARYIYRVLALREVIERPTGYGLPTVVGRASLPQGRYVAVRSQVADIAAFAAHEGTSVEALRAANPWWVGRTLTPTEGRSYRVLVPRGEAGPATASTDAPRVTRAYYQTSTTSLPQDSLGQGL